MSSLILLSLYSNDLSKYKNCAIKKHAFREAALGLQRNMSFIKSNFICKEKSKTVTKVKTNYEN